MKHTCHAIGCEEEVKPEKLMCLNHWRMVPDELKVQVYQAYVVGQCRTKKPSRLYLEVARRAITAVGKAEGRLT
jgi:hypothetical protein